MSLSVALLRHYLHEFNFEKLFTEELGWDRNTSKIPPVVLDGHSYSIKALAEKRGVQIFQCESDQDGKLPDHAARQKIEKRVTKYAYEHLIVFVDKARTVQTWQWVARAPGQPAKYREYAFHPKQQPGEILVQKLQGISFSLNEEEALDLTGTVHRLRDAFDRDKVTKRFFDRFQKEHAKFLKFVQGITETADREWYASLMLNRLMFVYFIQQKGFLDNDQQYLQNRLRMVQERKGKDKFYTFYRYFLLRLFHEGFSQQPAQRAADLEKLLGNVPYLNGGLFDVHELEQKHSKLDIPDGAFEGLFAFFDQYEWHLDTRPLHNDKEINPDVLGYIFEKYVNQKQMGAYYTKEDITEYISKNTIIPFLFESARKKCAIAFEIGSALWQLLRNDPERYIYEPVRRGVIDGKAEVIPATMLPEFVRKGMNDPKARMFDKRYNLGEADLTDEQGLKLTLPTETWREYVNRRKRCLELREKLVKGEINNVNDLITYNLNIRQLAEDAISTCEGPELLRAFYQAISKISVLDPTCGSGAFLFAALNILEPLYEACLLRMEAFLEDLEHSGERHRPEKFSDFKRTLVDIEKHPNRRYFILKSIIVNNLYGVDIMEEAVEICKLRLFLKLVAQVEKPRDLEPLPDIDFNIRPGNTLVGFARLDDVKRTLDGKLGFKKGQVEQIREEAEFYVERAYQRFHEMQTDFNMDAKEFAEAKRGLRYGLAHLTRQLDRFLATEYGISKDAIPDVTKYETAFLQWCMSHQPFHWFAEFYGIMSSGGFDVAIGNPPYVEYRKVESLYSVKGYVSYSCGDLYAYVAERSQVLLSRAGCFGMIVPVSISSTDGFQSLRSFLLRNTGNTWCLGFAERPSKLFTGVEKRLAIWLTDSKQKMHQIFTSNYRRWFAEEREFLFSTVLFARKEGIRDLIGTSLPKVATEIEAAILRKLGSNGRLEGGLTKRTGKIVYYTRKVRYFVQFFDFVPEIRDKKGNEVAPSELKTLLFSTLQERDAAIALLNSGLFFWFFCVYSDVRNVNRREISAFPCQLERMDQVVRTDLQSLTKELMRSFKKNARFLTNDYGKFGTLTIQSFQPRVSKDVLDQIDCILGKHYGFTNEELDFIINYDIKYRMGQESAEDEGE